MTAAATLTQVRRWERSLISVRVIHVSADNCDHDVVVEDSAFAGWRAALAGVRQLRAEYCDGRRVREWGWYRVVIS